MPVLSLSREPVTCQRRPPHDLPHASGPHQRLVSFQRMVRIVAYASDSSPTTYEEQDAARGAGVRRGRLDFSSIRRFLTWVVYELVLQAERSYAFGLAFLRTAEARYSRRRRLFRC